MDAMERHYSEDERYMEGELTESELKEVQMLYFSLREVDAFCGKGSMLNIPKIIDAIEFSDNILVDKIKSIDPNKERLFKDDGGIKKSLIIRMVYCIQVRDEWIEV